MPGGGGGATQVMAGYTCQIPFFYGKPQYFFCQQQSGTVNIQFIDIFIKLTGIFCKDFCTIFERVVVNNGKSTASECTRAKNIKTLQTEREHAVFLEISQISITKIHAGQRGWFATLSPAAGQTLLLTDLFSVSL